MIVWHEHNCSISLKNGSSSDWVKACSKVNPELSRKIELVNQLHSLAWLDGRCRMTCCSLLLLGSIWTMWLRPLLLTQRLPLFLRVFRRPLVLSTFLVTFFLALWVMVKNALSRHASKCPAYVAHECHHIMYLLDVDGNCFSIPA